MDADNTNISGQNRNQWSHAPLKDSRQSSNEQEEVSMFLTHPTSYTSNGHGQSLPTCFDHFPAIATPGQWSGAGALPYHYPYQELASQGRSPYQSSIYEENSPPGGRIHFEQQGISISPLLAHRAQRNVFDDAFDQMASDQTRSSRQIATSNNSTHSSSAMRLGNKIWSQYDGSLSSITSLPTPLHDDSSVVIALRQNAFRLIYLTHMGIDSVAATEKVERRLDSLVNYAAKYMLGTLSPEVRSTVWSIKLTFRRLHYTCYLKVLLDEHGDQGQGMQLTDATERNDTMRKAQQKYLMYLGQWTANMRQEITAFETSKRASGGGHDNATNVTDSSLI